MPPMALDVSEAQVCVGSIDDPLGYDWYHLVLILRLWEDGNWIACNGDLEVELVNLNDSRVVPLVRDQPIPFRCHANLCGFEAGVVDCDQALERVIDESRQLAGTLFGLYYQSAFGVSADRYYSGPANERRADTHERERKEPAAAGSRGEEAKGE